MLKQPVSVFQAPARERKAAKRRQNTAWGANPGIPGDTTDIRPEGAAENAADEVANPSGKGVGWERGTSGEGIAAFRLLWLSAWGFIPWRGCR